MLMQLQDSGGITKLIKVCDVKCAVYNKPGGTRDPHRVLITHEVTEGKVEEFNLKVADAAAVGALLGILGSLMTLSMRGEVAGCIYINDGMDKNAIEEAMRHMLSCMNKAI